MNNTAILMEAKHKLDEAVRKVNRLGRAALAESQNYLSKSAAVLCAVDPNAGARIFTDLVTAHAELLQAAIEFNSVRNAG